MGPWNGNSDGNRQRSLLLGFYIGPKPCAPRHVKGCFILGAVLTGTVVRSEWFTLEGWFNISSTDCAYAISFFPFVFVSLSFSPKMHFYEMFVFVVEEKQRGTEINVSFEEKNPWRCGLCGMKLSFLSQRRRLPRVQQEAAGWLQVGCRRAAQRPKINPGTLRSWCLTPDQ